MSVFKASLRPNSPARPRPLPRAIALQESNVAVEEPSLPVEETRLPAVTDVPRPPSPMQGMALRCTLVFLFFRISFLHEFITSKIKVDLHILMLLGGASLLTAFATGKLMVALRTRATMYWLLFAFCLCVATVFSTWRGGSFPMVRTRRDRLLTLRTQSQ